MNSEEQADGRSSGPWDSALEQLREWDPGWAEAVVAMSTDPWTGGVLPRKLVELIGIAIHASFTTLNPGATRRHIRAALKAGATRDEVLFVLKCASLLALHACSFGAPILLEESGFAEVPSSSDVNPIPTPACDAMRAVGQWNTAWDPMYKLDAAWTDTFFAAGIGIYRSGVLSIKEVELLSIALDASCTHMYAPGTRRHIRAALQAGATSREIMEVLKLCVVHGVEACNLGVPILAEELIRRQNADIDP